MDLLQLGLVVSMVMTGFVLLIQAIAIIKGKEPGASFIGLILNTALFLILYGSYDRIYN